MVMVTNENTQKVVLITGASSGVGKATAALPTFETIVRPIGSG
jgi:NADP-dependent 3-hydroxy acid dehydrogenase YdfG